LSLDQANRFKEVEKENTCLRKLVADLFLEKEILKDVAEGKY
jgi:putative transposase